MQARGKPFLADAILDPIPFGLLASLGRYQRLRQRFPTAPIMFGVGNLTELTEADTSGINAILFGIAAELGVAAVLTTQVSPHARRAVREADWARRIMHAAQRHQVLPKGLSGALMTIHDKRPFPDSPEEIAATAASVRDPNFRVQVSAEGIHVYNRDGLRLARDPFELWPQLGLEDDAAHAFYMGVETARAEIAFAARQTLCAGPAARLGLRRRPPQRRPGRLVCAGQHPERCAQGGRCQPDSRPVQPPAFQRRCLN